MGLKVASFHSSYPHFIHIEVELVLMLQLDAMLSHERPLIHQICSLTQMLVDMQHQLQHMREVGQVGIAVANVEGMAAHTTERRNT